MKKEIFDDFVQQHYEIQHPAPIKKGDTKVRARLQDKLAQIEAQEDWESDPELYELAEQIRSALEARPNLTLPYEIVKLKKETMICPDCNKECKTTRKVQSQIYIHPERHWRHSCNYCKQTMDPDTGKFTINNKSVTAYFVERFSQRDK